MSASAPVDLRGTTREIENSHIGGGSRGGYMGTLVLLIIFLFQSPRKAELFRLTNYLSFKRHLRKMILKRRKGTRT